MTESAPHERFADLTFESFQKMAKDESLSAHERSGFPDSYREGTEQAILDDILLKVPRLSGRGAVLVDVGCGATPLTAAIIQHCEASDHRLLLVDGPSVLALHAQRPGVITLPGRFPDVPGLAERWNGRCDAVIAYSVIQYAFVDASVFGFLDGILRLLAPGGRALVADLPNASMRRRFLSGEAGHAHHRAYTEVDREPDMEWPTLPVGEPDDAVTLALLSRARDAGFHGWVMPQGAGLPMANRREDLLFERP